MPNTAIQSLTRIISGGQTGVDRAALNIAIELNIPHGGWCPRGRRAEDGIINKHYQLKETDSDDYACRTEMNIRDSDGTLIINVGKLEGGTALTKQLANKIRKPILILNIDQATNFTTIYSWLNKHNIKILNIAGPRESKYKGIQSMTEQFLRNLLLN